MRSNWFISFPFAALLAVGFPGNGSAIDDAIDSPMYHEPRVPDAHAVKAFPEGLAPLWIAALGRPEAESKCQAALAIALAHRQGMKELDTAIPALRRELDRYDVNPEVALALAKALVALDARQSAPRLLQLLSNDAGSLAEIVDPALARWNYEPARAAWRTRLDQRPITRRTLLAIQSLALVHDNGANPRLRELALARDIAPAVRLQAARALAVIRTSGSEADAKSLTADHSPAGLTDRLVAVSLLKRHNSPEAIKQLLAFAVDAEPAIATIALTRLIEIDSKLIEPVLDRVLGSDDAEVRKRAVEVLSRNPTDQHLRQLGICLSDSHPDVRVKAQGITGIGRQSPRTCNWRRYEGVAGPGLARPGAGRNSTGHYRPQRRGGSPLGAAGIRSR